MRRTLEDAARCLVEQVFALFREATIEELAELLGGGRTPKPRSPAATGEVGDLRSRRRRAPSPTRSAVSEPERRGPAEEITDPGALLETVAHVEPSAEGAPEPNQLAIPAEPESTEQLVTVGTCSHGAAATASLRTGETIARATGAGLVIRRRKRAPAVDAAAIPASENEPAHDPPSAVGEMRV
jgi:hypothetical protein